MSRYTNMRHVYGNMNNKGVKTNLTAALWYNCLIYVESNMSKWRTARGEQLAVHAVVGLTYL